MEHRDDVLRQAADFLYRQGVGDGASAVDDVLKENDRLREALSFYSDGFGYLTPEGWQRIWRDGGKTARDALGGDSQ